MRHHNQNRKFGRVRKGRSALLNSLARSLVLHQKIETTLPKAKELRPFIEKLITRGRAQDIAARRTISTKIGKNAATILMNPIFKKYQNRTGGYTRIVKLNKRLSDGSPMAIIEFV